MIALYQSYILTNGVIAAALTKAVGANNWRYVDADEIIHGVLKYPEFTGFVMPGGADLYYCEKLNGGGNTAIHAFVDAGGVYLGICGGAYYGCAGLHYGSPEKGEHVEGLRELAFAPDSAEGPIMDILPQWPHGPERAITTLEYRGEKFNVLYHLGPRFTKAEGENVIARYTDVEGQPPAIITYRQGRGRAVLSGVHFEYDAQLFARQLYRHRNAFYAQERHFPGQLAITAGALQSLQREIFGFLR